MREKAWQEIPIGGMILDAGNSVEYHTGGWRAFRPVLGEAKCVDCMQCWLFCPDSSILVDADSGEMLGFNLDYCKGCGICAIQCPVNQKLIRKARERDEELQRDDPRLCIVMVEEGTIEV
jgi:pyruvate ferredoxin oxidoreductase delta subunit